MSLLEQKKLQWAAEKEHTHDWNPWGKPGCGAPMVSYTSTTVTHSTQQQQLTMWHQNFPKSENCSTDISTPLQIACTPSDYFGRIERNRLPPIPPSTVSPAAVGQRSIPSTIPSSSMEYNNNPFIYTYAYDLWREEAKKQWLQELEKQREEQRLKKLNSITNSNGEMLNSNISSKVNFNHLHPDSVNTSDNQPNNFPGLPSALTISSPMPEIDGHTSVNSLSNKGFVRGANVPVDPITQSELTLKRAKALEQQQMIQKQIEERRRLKDEEKAERKRRELEDEIRLAKENFMPHSINKDLIKKPEAKDSVKVATENISPEQTSGRLPDVLDGAVIDSLILPNKFSEAELKSHVNYQYTAPTQDNVATTSKNEKNVGFEVEEPYVVNRVLTPTKYRENPIKYRDIATQTDFPNGSFTFRKDVATSTKDNKGKLLNTRGTKTRNEPESNSKTKSKNTKDKSPACKLPDKNSKEQRNAIAKATTRSSRIDSYDNSSKMKRSEYQQKSCISRKINESSVAQQQPSAHRSRSRSSAEYQKKIIADETDFQSISQKRSLSPLMSYSRLTATGSSSTCDEGDMSTLPRQTRRKRRQWESPGRDEVPHFYTDSPQLPDGRSVRRNKYATDNKSFPTYVKDFSEMTAEANLELNLQSARSCSPPVPALRRLQLRQNIISEVNDFCPSENDAITHCQEPALEPTMLKPSLEDSISPGESAECQQSHQGVMSSAVNDNSTAPYFVQNNDVNRDILRKLTIIRHNLTLKQQEMNQISNGKKCILLSDNT